MTISLASTPIGALAYAVDEDSDGNIVISVSRLSDELDLEQRLARYGLMRT